MEKNQSPHCNSYNRHQRCVLPFSAVHGPGGAGLTVQRGLFVGDELSVPKGTCSPVGCAGLFLLHPERKAEPLAETSIVGAEQKPEERKGEKILY